VTYEFDHWLHGGEMYQDIFIPQSDITYTAVFVESENQAVTLTATKDAHVRDGASAGINYGGTAAMETKLDVTANSGYNREVYMSFDMSSFSGSVTNAELRIFGNLGAAATIPVDVYSSSNTTWSETTINWTNKPTTGTTALATNTLTSVTGQYHTWDVTAYIAAEKAAGRNIVTFNLKNMAVSGPQTVWSTKEGANPPQLVVSSIPVVSNQLPYLGLVRSIPGQIEGEHYDEGGQGIAYNDATVGNEGGALRTDDVGVQVTGDVTGGGHNIGWTVAGEWLEYTVEIEESGNYDFALRVAASQTGKSLHIEIDGINVTGSVNVPASPTGGWQDYFTVTIPNIVLTHDHDQHERIMRVVFDSDGVNFNYVNITPSATGTDPLTQTYFHLIDNLTGDYMRPANNGSATAVIALYQQTTTPTFDSYQWQFVVVPNTSYYYIKNKYTGKVIQPGSVFTNGSTIAQVDLVGNEANEAVHWIVTPSTVAPAYYWIKNRASGFNIRPFNGSNDDAGTGTVNLVQNTLVEAYSSFRWQLNGLGAVSARLASDQLATDQELVEDRLEVYPNPATDRINLSQTVSWELIDLTGIKVVSGHGNFIDTTHLKGGIYLIKTPEQTKRVMILN